MTIIVLEAVCIGRFPLGSSMQDPHQRLLISEAQATKKGTSRCLTIRLQTIFFLFCDGETFFVDRSLL
jgi:hypothetical protein